MATVASLLVRLSADSSGLEKGLKGASDKLAKTGESMGKIGKGLTIGVTLPLLAIGGAAIKSAIDFEDSFADVAKTVDATDEVLAGLKQSFRDMAKEIPVSVNEINAVGAAAGQLGIQTENIIDFTEVMLNLGVASDLSSEQAATALARFANITQMSQDDFEKLGSVIVDLGNNMASTESEIVNMGLRLAGAGTQLGFAESDTLAFSAALSSVGVRAEAGGTAMSDVMLSIQKSVGEGGESLKQLAAVSGMTADQFKQAFEKDSAKTINSFITGLGDMTAAGENITPVLDELGFGAGNTRDALSRLSGAGNLLNDALDRGRSAWVENTALQAEADAKYKTTANQLILLKNNLHDTAITLGDALLPIVNNVIQAFGPFIERIAGLANKFAELSPQTQGIILSLIGVVMAIGPLLLIAAKLIVAFTTVSGVIAKAGGVIAILTGPIGIAIAIIAALIAIGIALYKNWGTITNFFTNTVPQAFSRFTNSVKSAGQNVINGFINPIKKIPGEVTRVFNNIENYISNLPGKLFAKAKNMGTSLWNGFKKGLGIGSPSLLERALFAIGDSAFETVDNLHKTTSGFQRFAQKISQPIPAVVPTGSIRMASAGANGVGITPIQGSPQQEAETASGGVAIQIQNMFVREESDIRKVAQELYRLQQARLRSQGGRI